MAKAKTKTLVVTVTYKVADYGGLKNERGLWKFEAVPALVSILDPVGGKVKVEVEEVV
jgi:hypothetical protein